MNSYNQVRLTGKIAFDPEIKDIKDNRRVGSFKMEALASRGKTYVEVTVWDEKLIKQLESLMRGDRIKIAGELRSSSWESQEGKKRSKVYVIAEALVDLENVQGSIDNSL